MRLQEDLLKYILYQTTYNVITTSLKRKGQAIREHLDPQQGTAEEAMSYADFEKLGQYYIMRNSLPDAQNRATALHLYATTGRGDEARELRLPDVLPPRASEAIGTCSHMHLHKKACQ